MRLFFLFSICGLLCLVASQLGADVILQQAMAQARVPEEVTDRASRDALTNFDSIRIMEDPLRTAVSM
jgi:hypothetical protein